MKEYIDLLTKYIDQNKSEEALVTQLSEARDAIRSGNLPQLEARIEASLLLGKDEIFSEEEDIDSLAQEVALKKNDAITKYYILDIADEVKQRNLLANFNNLLAIKIDGPLTTEQADEYNSIKAIWDSIQKLIAEGKERELSILNSVA